MKVIKTIYIITAFIYNTSVIFYLSDLLFGFLAGKNSFSFINNRFPILHGILLYTHRFVRFQQSLIIIGNHQ